MAQVTRDQLVDALQNGWGCYTEQFWALPEAGRDECLKKQGYVRLADLVGHVMAWWETALVHIPRMAVDPGFTSPDVDVDAFNARAVARFSKQPEEEVIGLYEFTRERMLALVQSLPETAFNDPRINARLAIEIVGHLDEHRF
jgi:hypothetical protein